MFTILSVSTYYRIIINQMRRNFEEITPESISRKKNSISVGKKAFGISCRHICSRERKNPGIIISFFFRKSIHFFPRNIIFKIMRSSLLGFRAIMIMKIFYLTRNFHRLLSYFFRVYLPARCSRNKKKNIYIKLVFTLLQFRYTYVSSAYTRSHIYI